MQNPQQQQGRGKRFQRNFAQSNYITAAWNWFMTLAGKAAEPVLTISVLYSCARLLPAVHLPVQADNTVFIAQMIALDVGGLSLGKMAKAARAADNEEGATLAGRVSIALISIMVANVVLSVLQTIIPGLSGQLVAVIEALLLVARAIMAVLYAHVIHSLKGTLDEQPLPPALPAIDIQQIVTQVITGLQTQFEERLSAMASEQARMIAEVKSQLPAVNTQEIAETVLSSLESRFTSEMKSFQADLRQQVVISSPLDETVRRLDGAEFRQPNEAQIPPAQQSISASKKSPSEPARLNSTNREKIRPLHPVENRETQVVRMWNEDRSRSTQTIAALTGVPKSTVAYYLKPYREQLDNDSASSNGTIA